MSRIIFLTDVFDVRNENDLPNSPKSIADKQFGNYAVKNKYNFWSRYLGPYIVSASIKKNLPEYDIVVLDYFTKLDNFEEAFSQLVTEDTEYIALSVTFLHNPFNPKQNAFNLWFLNHDDLCAWFDKLKQMAPKAKIMVGGAHIDTIFKTHVTKKSKKPLPLVMSKYIDYAFHGYGEETVVKFLKNELDPMDIHVKEGVTFIDQPLLAGKGAIIIPNKWEENYAIQHNEWLPLEVSKGCRFGCKFCFYDHSGTIIKKPEELKQELIYNYENFGVTGYTLTDDTVNDSMAKITMMHEVITSLPFKVEWVAYTRPDMFHKFPQMLPLMLEMGCRGMFLGVETFNHLAAKRAGKGLHPDKIKTIIQWIRETAGKEIFLLASFIIGLVGETEESLEDTLQWLYNQRFLDKVQYETLYISDEGGRTSNDFSEQKSRFGFKVLQWDPEYYWEHDTLNFKKCREIASHWEETMANHPTTLFERHANFNTSFWAYPRVRSFGYTHHEAVSILTGKYIPENVYNQNIDWIRKYHSDLISLNKKQ